MPHPTRVALITGCGKAIGIGNSTARALAAKGLTVVVSDVRPAGVANEFNAPQDTDTNWGGVDSLVEAIAQAGGTASSVLGDVSQEADANRMVAEVLARYGRLDILVNNAGANWGARFEKFEWKGWERVLSVNVAGLFTLTRDLMPLLTAAGSAERPSNIINIGSVMGTITQSESAYSYAAAKSAVHHLTRILAIEFAGRHVTVNAIAPGPFKTKMTAFTLDKQAGLAAALEGVPMGRLGRPEDLAATVLYLAGRGGAYTTGAVIPVDGGVSVYAPPPMLSEVE
jgi:NAD(P)-dependent dehydrogenase (short-subunit alcohol dehydrogenase family)